MSQTAPVDFITKSITDLNVPDCPVDSLETRFIYNYFVNNEMIDDTGMPLPDGGTATQIQALLSGGTSLKSLARYVTLQWSTPERFTSNNVDLFLDNSRLIDLSAASSAGLVNRETDVTIDGRDIVVYQDKDLVKQITSLIDTSALYRLGALPGSELSQNEVATLLNDMTPDDVDGELLLEMASDPSRFGVTYINEAEGKKIELNPLRSAASQRFSLQVDRSVLRDITDQQSRNPFSSDCVFSLLDRKLIEAYQMSQVQNDHTGIDLESDFEPAIQAFAVSSGVTTYSPPELKIAGYVVEKFEVFKDGRRELKESIFVSNPGVNQTIDTKIKYGKAYAYTVSTVCLLSFTEAVVSGGGSSNASLGGNAAGGTRNC